MAKVLIGIDLGKTNLRVGVYTPEFALVSRWSVSAVTPATALDALTDHIETVKAEHTVLAAGVSTFGPLDTDPASAGFGSIVRSSAPAWINVNLPAAVRSALQGPIHFDYDVNAGAMAEAFMGSGIGVTNFVYLSLGTGIGAVSYHDGLIAGYAPQLGHMALPREADDLSFPGACPFHGGCFQGLASGSALEARWGTRAEELDIAHPAWDLEARYIARACTNLVYTFAPTRILLASSVALAPGLIEASNKHLHGMLQGFLDPQTAARYAAEPPVQRAHTAPDSSLLGAALMAARRLGLAMP